MAICASREILLQEATSVRCGLENPVDKNACRIPCKCSCYLHVDNTKTTTDYAITHKRTRYKISRNIYKVQHLKVPPPNNNEGRKLQISPNFASNRNMLRAITRDVEGK